VYPIIGSPVEQVKSPLFFNRYFSDFGVEARMMAIDVYPSELEGFFTRLRESRSAKGCVVTVPHKAASVAFVDRLSGRAATLGALNVVRVEGGRLSGDMVDGLGFLAAVESRGFSCANKRIGIVGLGAAGSAIAHAAASGGASEIAIQERDSRRHEFAEETLKPLFPEVEWTMGMASLERFDLIVNASPVGMNGDPCWPVPLDSVSPNCLVMDLVTKPKTTPFLGAAMERGCEVVYGAEMIRGQFKRMGRFMGLDIPDSYRPDVE